MRVPGRVARLLPDPKSLAVKRFMARYIFYLEMFGYIAVSLVALAIFACFFFRVDIVLRHDGDPVAIKPKAKTIKRKAESLVTKVLVQNHQVVRKGDPLVEIVEDPKWMSRYLVMHQLQTLVDEFNAPGQAAELAKERIEQAQKEAREAALAEVKKAGPAMTETEEKKEEKKEQLPPITLTLEEAQLYIMSQQRLQEWESRGIAVSPRILIRAPIDGTVVAPDDLPFKKVEADKEILKVVDLNDLRITAKVVGDKVADARTGQKAHVLAIVPDFKTGVVFRGDTIPKGRWFWQKERVMSYALLDAKIKDAVKDAFKDRKITQRDDIPFNLTEVTDVEINTDLKTVPVGGTQIGTAAGRADAALPSPTPDTRHPTPAEAPISGDLPSEMELSGKVLEGKHLLKVQIADMPPAVVQKAADAVRSKLQGQLVEAPQEPEQEGGPAPVETLRVEDFRIDSIIAKVKGENPDAKGPTKALKREARRKAVRGASLERQYEATVQIENPPRALKERVLQLLQDGKEVKAKIEVVTGRRPVAFLLLKR